MKQGVSPAVAVVIIVVVVAVVAVIGWKVLAGRSKTSTGSGPTQPVNPDEMKAKIQAGGMKMNPDGTGPAGGTPPAGGPGQPLRGPAAMGGMKAKSAAAAEAP